MDKTVEQGTDAKGDRISLCQQRDNRQLQNVWGREPTRVCRDKDTRTTGVFLVTTCQRYTCRRYFT